MHSFLSFCSVFLSCTGGEGSRVALMNAMQAYVVEDMRGVKCIVVVLGVCFI